MPLLMRHFNPQVRTAGSEQNSLLASSHLHLPYEPGLFTQTQNKGVSKDFCEPGRLQLEVTSFLARKTSGKSPTSVFPLCKFDNGNHIVVQLAGNGSPLSELLSLLL